MSMWETTGTGKSVVAERRMSELVHVLSEQEATWEQIDEEPLQELIECLLKVYARKLQPLGPAQPERDILPLPRETTLSETEAIVFADRLLRKTDIDLFEVQMFRSLCF